LAPKQAIPKELVIRNIDGKTVTMPLDRDRISLGRSSSNELCYPDDAGLSRQHLALTHVDGQWFIEDLGSKNGTLMNGKRLERKLPFHLGDRIAAGHLNIEFASAGVPLDNTVMFVDHGESVSSASTTVVASLDTVLGPPADDLNKTYRSCRAARRCTRAHQSAGRELAGHRPLDELFQVIMDLIDGRRQRRTRRSDDAGRCDNAACPRESGRRLSRFRVRCAIASSMKKRLCWCAMRSSIWRCAST
jgi:sigma-B regulation protein RsbU (phosphoserine phosphatase)